jgi:MbtH protein
MTNPFEDPEGTYLVVVNDEKQYSLWPAFAQVPAGWRVVHQDGTYQGSLDFISETWTDMAPETVGGEIAGGRTMARTGAGTAR